MIAARGVGLRRSFTYLLAMVAGLAIVGCAQLEGDPEFELSAIELIAEPNANLNQPVAVDLVIIQDAGMVGALTSLSAADWFARKAQFKRDFANGFTVRSWEIVPDYSVPAQAITETDLEGPNGGTARAGFLFARYVTAGEHRARIETGDGVRVRLGRDSFILEDFVFEE